MRILAAVIMTLFVLILIFAGMLYGFYLGKKAQFQKDMEGIFRALQDCGYDDVAEYMKDELRKKVEEA